MNVLLFTDGSVDVSSNTGYGAYLLVKDSEVSIQTLKERVKTKRFENTSSTRLELETLLWALDEMAPAIENKMKIVIYTDSQNIAGLPGRREKLEKNDFYSKNNRLMNNHDLYREFFKVTDKWNCEFIKVTGHQPSFKKDFVHQLFTLVDKASRKALRKET